MPPTPQQLAGEGNTVVVGVKMDAQSKELLTWALVKLTHPGDLLVALHVLASNEVLDEDGKSSLLSLVKAFDSVLAVYEGFCNLKQVDLKLKICRGSSIRKILVREANSYDASKLVVGTAAKHHTIRSSTSVAKYCARKLPKDCSVLAVRNGKVVFQREAPPSSPKNSKGLSDNWHNGIIEGLERASTIDLQIHDVETWRTNETITKQNCTICSAGSISPSNGLEGNSIALVPLQKLEASSSSISLLVKELPQRRSGWPLFRRNLLFSRQDSNGSSSKDVSVVQWSMLLPSRFHLSYGNSSPRVQNCDQRENGGQTDALVPVGVNSLANQKRLDKDPRSMSRELEGLHEKYSSLCRLFQYEELQAATSNFMAEYLIGKGGTSQVYRGSLPDGKVLAVKILKPTEDALQEFVMEIEIITSLHHKNIISLVGFCFENKNPLLVYDLLPKGSLEENLHGSKKDLIAFGWNERFKVAVGVAEALDYLHNHSVQSVIHRDVKSSNILLSNDFEPQLSDFGLAKLASTSSQITCTDVAGTFGYMAPEYFMYGKVTDKLDVYAFGVVLLELLSGRKPISNEQPKGQESLVMWAKPILNGGKVSKLLDPCMDSNYNQDQIERMVLAATLCIRRAPRARPQLSLILKLLQGDGDIIKWAKLQVNNASENSNNTLDENGLPHPDIHSHLSLALLDIEDDSLSISSIEQNMSLEEYLRGRWSRSSSFD